LEQEFAERLDRAFRFTQMGEQRGQVRPAAPGVVEERLSPSDGLGKYRRIRKRLAEVNKAAMSTQGGASDLWLRVRRENRLQKRLQTPPFLAVAD